MAEVKPYTPLTSEQEAALRDATTIGDADTTHAAGVLAWRNLWALVDLLRDDAHKALAREDSCINELAAGRAKFASLATELRATAEIVVAATPPGMTYTASLPVDTRNALDHLRSALAAREAEIVRLRDALFDLVNQCERADVNEDLGDVDYSKARDALPTCGKCGGHGTHDGLSHEDESDVPRCEGCLGWGYLASAPSSRAALDAMLAQARHEGSLEGARAALDEAKRVCATPDGHYFQTTPAELRAWKNGREQCVAAIESRDPTRIVADLEARDAR